MSANDTNKDSAPESPAAAVQKPAAAKNPAAPKRVSRLYARMRRDKAGTPPPASASLSGEPVTQIDNLPVRATAPSHLVDDSSPQRDDRPERSERREYSDRGDRGRRGGRDDRGGRRDRGGRDERGGREDRGRGRRRSDDRRSQDDRPPQTTWEAPSEEVEARTPYDPSDEVIEPNEFESTIENETVEEISGDDESEPRRRGPRFEAADEGENDRSHLIQEFKPSRHAERARSDSAKKTGSDAGKKGSLMGWIKSVFTGGGETPETPERPSSPSRDRQSGGGRGRGSRSRGQGGRGPNADSSSARTDGEGRPRRRRRRRSGGGGEGGSGGGGGRGRGGRGPRREG